MMERFMELLNHEAVDKVIVSNTSGMCKVTVYRKGDAHLISFIQATFEESVERCLDRLRPREFKGSFEKGGSVDSGPSCDQCGAMMQRTGSCYTCRSCGNNTGCG